MKGKQHAWSWRGHLLLAASSELAAAWMMGGCSPTTPHKPPLPVLTQRMRLLQACPAVYNADTWRANRPPCSQHTPEQQLFQHRSSADGEMPEASRASSVSSVLSSWVKRSLIVRSDWNTCQFLALHFVFETYDKEECCYCLTEHLIRCSFLGGF